MIELTTPQFLTLIGLSGAQLIALWGIFLRLGRLIVGHADLEARVTKLERSPLT